MGTAEAKLRQLVDDILAGAVDEIPAGADTLWAALEEVQGESFLTAKGLEFTYSIRGFEMFASRKEKSLTRATVGMAFARAMELQQRGGGVSGPKKLGTFGASYLYPVFIRLGVIRGKGEQLSMADTNLFR